MHKKAGWRLRSKRGLLSLLLATGALLCSTPRWAHADVWAFVDARGVTHFAAEKLDARYQLFFKGSDFDSTRDGAAAAVRGGTGLRSESHAAAAGKLANHLARSAPYRQVRHHVESTAKRTGLDADLLKALIATESGFDVDAVSPKGAVGLMQVMPATAERFGVRADSKRSVADKLADPATNLHAGTRYLQYLMTLFPGRLDLVLAAYNAGENAVRRSGSAIPPYKETQNYVRTVLALYEHLQPGATGSPAGNAATARSNTPRPTGRVRMELPSTQPAADMTDTLSLLP